MSSKWADGGARLLGLSRRGDGERQVLELDGPLDGDRAGLARDLEPARFTQQTPREQRGGRHRGVVAQDCDRPSESRVALASERQLEGSIGRGLGGCGRSAGQHGRLGTHVLGRRCARVGAWAD
jgi:hypothetical protein